MKTFLESVLIVVIAFAVALLTPSLGFALGYFSGLVLNLFVGEMITNGINSIVGEGTINASQIPLICACISSIGTLLCKTKFFDDEQND